MGIFDFISKQNQLLILKNEKLFQGTDLERIHILTGLSLLQLTKVETAKNFPPHSSFQGFAAARTQIRGMSK